jgi:hypothetical protein
MRRSGCRYSITSSARASSEDGTARPSALAVLRFTISSDFVDACTGGLPLRPIREVECARCSPAASRGRSWRVGGLTVALNCNLSK